MIAAEAESGILNHPASRLFAMCRSPNESAEVMP